MKCFRKNIEEIFIRGEPVLFMILLLSAATTAQCQASGFTGVSAAIRSMIEV